MGFISHDAIVFTDNEYTKNIKKVREKAIKLGLPVSEIVESNINGYLSFFVAPDGSKEGWDDSNSGDEARRILIQFVEIDCHVDFAHIRYGGDMPEAAKLVNFNFEE